MTTPFIYPAESVGPEDLAYGRWLWDRGTLLLLVLAIRGMLDLTYVFFLARHYSYVGFSVDVTLLRFGTSVAVLLAAAQLLPRSALRPSDFAISLLFILIVMPLTSLWAWSGHGGPMLLYATASLIVIRALCTIRLTWVPAYLREGRVVAYALMFLIPAALFGWFLARGGVESLVLDPRKVYEIRDAVHDTLLTGIWGYLTPWTGKAILPLALAYSILNRRHVLAFLVVAATFLLYAFTGHKEYVLYPLVILFTWVCYRRGWRYERALFTAIAGVLGISLITELASGVGYPLALTAMRGFFMTAYNHAEYYMFFQDHPYTYWSNSVARHWVEYPFAAKVPELIGWSRYAPGEAAFANAGFLASGYMHAGPVGVGLYTLLVAVLLKIYDAFTRAGMEPWVLAGLAACGMIQLVNADLPSALLTHGILVTLLLLALLAYRRREASGRRPPRRGGG